MEIKIKDIEEKKVAYVSATGSYEQLPELFGEVVGYAMKEELDIIEEELNARGYLVTNAYSLTD